MWYVYILLCEDGSFYTGCTTDVARRFSQHQLGRGGHYTRSHKPLKVIYQQPLETQSLALKREAEIKSWSKAQKTQLVESALSSRTAF